ncbi:glycoside hydrolase family protein [Herminiimonas contaminans]|uniref:Lysozyme n=1 Tax=Herminiimonas contaminans TaxID=1111140 RepID=A0ABS0ESB3_9BURK|nr:glycoside hydrolase family protein [Herminiimonas contaminans]MBF8177649.1 glycoside hydrolase family protein [Herminiimonas contaminans]
MSDNITRLLRGDEGEVLYAYNDHLGFATIGIGRLIDKRKGGGITPEESAYLLANDIMRKSMDLDARLPWWKTLSDARRGVLLAMAFQMGIDGLLGFKNTLEAVRTGQYDRAADGMLQSMWAKQTPERAKRMSEQMRTDQWKFKEGT